MMLLLLFFALKLDFLCAEFVGNYIIGSPKVNCEENDVTLDIITSKPFTGNIFVKGHSKDSSCIQSYGDVKSARNRPRAYSLALGKCGMRRLRQINPRGINFALTIIVSFHPRGFITKNDRAYNIQCFYKELDEIVSSDIQVSGLPPRELHGDINMPSCEYTVHGGNVNGPPVSYANVGEAVYHVWRCTGPEMGLLIKKCFVTDGDGEDHAVIDENGCSLDNSLLSEINYNSSSMVAYAKSQAFKYADSNQLYFTCQIKMCQKDVHLCEGITPPNCNKNNRRKRASIFNSLKDKQSGENERKFLILKQRKRMNRLTEIDVTTPELFIFDGAEREIARPFIKINANLSNADNRSSQPESVELAASTYLLYLVIASIGLSIIWTMLLIAVISCKCKREKFLNYLMKMTILV